MIINIFKQKQIIVNVAPILSFIMFFFFAAPTFAVDAPPITIGISPAVTEIRIDKGTSTARSILLENKEDSPLAIRVHAENFEAADPFGGIKFNSDDTAQYSSKGWLKFDSQSIVLDPKSQTKVNFSINSPQDAEPGGHYSVIFFEPLSTSNYTESSTVGVSQRIGALIFITVSGDNKEQGMVLGANTSSSCSGLQCSFKTPLFRQWGPVPFTFDFINTGNVHTKASAKIEIFNIFGKKLAEIPIDEKTVLPGSTRTFEAKWLREILFGKYTAKLTVRFGNQNMTQTATTTFWVIPWKPIMVVLFAVYVVVSFFKFLTNKNRKDFLKKIRSQSK